MKKKEVLPAVWIASLCFMCLNNEIVDAKTNEYQKNMVDEMFDMINFDLIVFKMSGLILSIKQMNISSIRNFEQNYNGSDKGIINDMPPGTNACKMIFEPETKRGYDLDSNEVNGTDDIASVVDTDEESQHCEFCSIPEEIEISGVKVSSICKSDDIAQCRINKNNITIVVFRSNIVLVTDHGKFDSISPCAECSHGTKRSDKMLISVFEDNQIDRYCPNSDSNSSSLSDDLFITKGNKNAGLTESINEIQERISQQVNQMNNGMIDILNRNKRYVNLLNPIDKKSYFKPSAKDQRDAAKMLDPTGFIRERRAISVFYMNTTRKAKIPNINTNREMTPLRRYLKDGKFLINGNQHAGRKRRSVAGVPIKSVKKLKGSNDELSNVLNRNTRSTFTDLANRASKSASSISNNASDADKDNWITLRIIKGLGRIAKDNWILTKIKLATGMA